MLIRPQKHAVADKVKKLCEGHRKKLIRVLVKNCKLQGSQMIVIGNHIEVSHETISN